MERRFFKVTEIRAVKGGEGESPVIEGHAAVFNSMSEDLGGFREIIQPGAFKKTIGEADVRALHNHDANIVLGRNKAGTLEMEEDKQGLKVRIHPPDTQQARDLMVSIDRGDIDQMSFGFQVINDKWETKGEENIRTLQEVRLFDVSTVTFPAYTETDVGIRADAIARIAVRKQNGLDLSDDDEKIIKLMRDIFTEPGPAPHSDKTVVNFKIEGNVLDAVDLLPGPTINQGDPPAEPGPAFHSREAAERERMLRIAAIRTT